MKLQSNFIFVDTESYNNKISKEKEILTFKLGCSIFWNRKENIKIENIFYNINEFWNNVESFFDINNRDIIIFAHNTQFDFKMLDGFNQLLNRDWILKSHYVKNTTFILVFRKKFSDGKLITLHIWDTMNYVREKLEIIGESVGFPKLSVDFNNVSDKELEVYCKRDTEIIFQFIKKLIEFLKRNDLSRLKATAGSLSFNIFRHKFYNPTKDTDKIYIHDWKRVIKLERECYRGGITDCFKLGKHDNLYKLDINSMYPKVMKNNSFPIKLICYKHEGLHSNKYLMNLYNSFKNKRNYEVIVKATIQLDSNNAYILNNFGTGKSIFAHGIFEITLCNPELKFIERNGYIKIIHEIAIYRTKKIFKDFVGFFYDLKVHYKKQSNKVNEKFCKLILNTQHGKWGQRNIEHINLNIKHKFMIEYQEIIKLMIFRIKEINPNFNLNQDICYLGSIVDKGELYIVNGKLYLLKQTQKNSKDSFVAISSFITSYSRMLLVKYIKIAKRKNICYVDTDSLFVNEFGYQNLLRKGYIDEFELGKLKIEGKGTGIFYSPKFYDFDNIRKCKGIKKDSIILLENKKKVVYQVNLWQKFKADLKLGYTNEQIIKTTTKESKKIYDKGNIDKFNNVYPFSIKEIINITKTEGLFEKMIRLELNTELREIVDKLNLKHNKLKLIEIKEFYNNLNISEKDFKKVMLKVYNNYYSQEITSYTSKFNAFYEFGYLDILNFKISQEKKRIIKLNKNFKKQQQSINRYYSNKSINFRFNTIRKMLDSQYYNVISNFDIRDLLKSYPKWKNQDIVNELIDLYNNGNLIDSDIIELDEIELRENKQLELMRKYYENKE